MGFHRFSSPYDWSRVAGFKDRARAVAGGMIDLSVGSPVDPVPASVQQALASGADAADAHGYPLTAGSTALQDELVHWFVQARGVDLQAIGASVVPTVGSKEAVALMASLLHLNPGDVVVQPQVSYPTYAIGTQLAGAKVMTVADVADVDSWLSVPRVKAIWVNSPNNPTGEVLSAGQLRDIVAAARSIGAVVLSDECYAQLVWSEDGSRAGNAPCVLSSDVCGRSSQGVLCLYSLSKQSNMAGYRTACIAGDRSIVDDMTVYRKQIGQIVPGPVQAAMVAALQDEDAVSMQQLRYAGRLRKLVTALQQYGYDARMPQGGLYVWVRALGRDCWEDMERLATLGVVPSPGEFYGDASHLRFSATATDEDIDVAVQRLVR